MGVFTGAGQDCKNRAQLVVARRQPAEGEDPEDLRNYRVAHDFRGLNAKTILDPWPMTTLEEMTMWDELLQGGCRQGIQSGCRAPGFDSPHQI